MGLGEGRSLHWIAHPLLQTKFPWFEIFICLFRCFCLCVCVFVFVWFACVCVFLCVSIILNEQVNDVAFSGIFEVEESHKEKKFFLPLYWGALFHREKTVMNPQTTKCHRSTKIMFFRHFWYFPITKAIHTYVLAKFKTRFLPTTTHKRGFVKKIRAVKLKIQ